MSSYPPNPASRPPGASWAEEDEGFRVIPTGGVSSAPPGVSSAPPPPMAPPGPPPGRGPVVAPLPTRAPAPPAPAGRQRLLIAMAAAAILIAALVFFLVTRFITLRPVPTVATLVVVQTAVAGNLVPTALPACDALLRTPAPTTTASDALAQAYLGCGKVLVHGPEQYDVTTALQYFQKAASLSPNNPEIQHQLDLVARYQKALQTVDRADVGGYITQLEWFAKQPEFGNQPYADTAVRLYQAYMKSGDGYVVGNCGQARHRFEQALAMRFVDTSEAQQRLKVLPACTK